MVFLDDIYNEEECDFLIKYFYKNYRYECNNGKNNSEILCLMMLPDGTYRPPLKRWFEFKVNRLRWRSLRKINEKFPFLKLMYDQLVHWPTGEYMEFHYDRPYTPWASVCYLNDDYSGGETVVEGTSIKPKRGRLILFNGLKFKHGVNPVKGDRYTYTSWFGVK